MPDRYPPIEPYQSGLLDTGDGNQVYWEASGNPAGLPALFLHGGPGGGSSDNSRRYFDPARYRIVCFDQRNCGRSTPSASEPGLDLATNTTQHLIADMESIRDLLGVDRWTLLGVSWGTALAMAYAEQHPTAIRALVLGAVVTSARREIDWITEDVGRVFPREWDAFAAAIPDRLRGRRLVEAYAELLADPDPAIHEPAARAWCAWEDAHVSLAPGWRPNERYQDPAYRLRFARLVTHYWSRDGFLGDFVLDNVDRLRDIPGVLVHGRYDVSGPLEAAWRLSRRWPASRLVVIEDEGHGGASMSSELIAALDGFANLPR